MNEAPQQYHDTAKFAAEHPVECYDKTEEVIFEEMEKYNQGIRKIALTRQKLLRDAERDKQGRLGRGGVRCRDERGDQVEINNNHQGSKEPSNTLQEPVVCEFAHNFGVARKVQYREQCKGKLNTLQNVQPLVQNVRGSRAGAAGYPDRYRRPQSNGPSYHDTHPWRYFPLEEAFHDKLARERPGHGAALPGSKQANCPDNLGAVAKKVAQGRACILQTN